MTHRLLALSDLHVNRPANLAALRALPPHPGDWLLVPGDVGDGPHDLDAAFEILTDRFDKVFWCPGNHELWTRGDATRGVARYQALVACSRRWGVVTPEDPFVVWPGPDGPVTIAPCFVGYDFSFRPPDVPADGVVAWAAKDRIYAADDRMLHADPHPDRQTWCAHRLALTEERLAGIDAGPIVLMNHYPLRHEHVLLPKVPRYAPWCGTTGTHTWHQRFPLAVVVSGHLHVRSTRWQDGVRFEEVSLGYPRHWREEVGLAAYIRQILPAPAGPRDAGPVIYW